MTLAAKQRAVATLVLLLAIWPLGHHALVRRYELNPWYFFGWAMYCVPRLEVAVGVVGYRASEPDGRPLPERVHQGQVELGRQRLAWGRLASADALARLTFESVSGLDSVVVVIDRTYLDIARATIRTRRDYEHYERRGAEVQRVATDSQLIGSEPPPLESLPPPRLPRPGSPGIAAPFQTFL